MRTILVDTECYSLAQRFTHDNQSATKAQVMDLAQTIQSAIDNWMEEQDDNAEAKRQDAHDRAVGI